MNNKLFSLFLGLACLSLSGHLASAAEADWEILNLAIANPGQSNPRILADSVLNIIGSFVPPAPAGGPAPAPAPPAPATPAPATPAPATPAPATPAPAPVTPSPSVFSNPAVQALLMQYLLQQRQAQAAAAATPATPAPGTNGPIIVGPISNPPTCPTCTQPAPSCGCKKPQKPSLAEFLVNVPCPTTTPKPPRQIVVKVPCPTTTVKPCECKCCPCNPCPTPSTTTKAPTKAPKKRVQKQSSEELSSEDTQTVYRSYEPIKTNKASNRPVYSPSGRSQVQVKLQPEFDERFY